MSACVFMQILVQIQSGSWTCLFWSLFMWRTHFAGDVLKHPGMSCQGTPGVSGSDPSMNSSSSGLICLYLSFPAAFPVLVSPFIVRFIHSLSYVLYSQLFLNLFVTRHIVKKTDCLSFFGLWLNSNSIYKSSLVSDFFLFPEYSFSLSSPAYIGSELKKSCSM